MNVPYSSHSGRPPKPVPRRGPLELAVSTTEAVAPEAPGPRPGTRLRRGVILGILITVAVFVLLQVLPDYLLKELILHRLQEELGQPVSAQRVSVSHAEYSADQRAPEGRSFATFGTTQGAYACRHAGSCSW